MTRALRRALQRCLFAVALPCAAPAAQAHAQNPACLPGRAFVFGAGVRSAGLGNHVLAALTAPRQSAPVTPPSEGQLQALADGQRWSEIVRLLGHTAPRTAQMNYDYGMALAHLGRWADARSALKQGWRLAPQDARFPVELAGVAFKQKRNGRAEKLLRQALRLIPHDTYANDFLATLYFLDNNLEAALKYWNRIGKPQIAAIVYDPQPRVSPGLLDHALTFAPASTMLLPQYLATASRLRGLGIFPHFQLDLNARDDGRFNAKLRTHELNGWGGSGWMRLLVFARGLPFQEVQPAYFNLRRQAINIDSMLRWDAQKRRIFADASGPLVHGAKYRWQGWTDLRNENWAILPSFTGPAPLEGAFNMRTERGGFNVEAFSSGSLGWRAGAELSHRDFRSVNPGSVLTPQMLASGYELKQRAQVDGTLWRQPERRLALRGGASAEVARLWSQPRETFGRLTASLGWRWFPQRQGGDYATTQQLRIGRIFGQAPFDELYILGLERDNNLPMHAHIGTRDGRKGSAPLGREYFLHNWELDKNLYSNGLVAVRLGPLLDLGRIADPGAQLGSHLWLLDTGAVLKVSVLGMGLAFSYGRDLRTGNNAFYAEQLE